MSALRDLLRVLADSYWGELLARSYGLVPIKQTPVYLRCPACGVVYMLEYVFARPRFDHRWIDFKHWVTCDCCGQRSVWIRTDKMPWVGPLALPKPIPAGQSETDCRIRVDLGHQR